MNPVYRKATTADAPALMQLGLDAYGVFQKDLSPDNWREFKERLEDGDALRHLMQTATTFFCEADDRVAGCAFLVPPGHPTDIYAAEWAYIRKVGVHPDYAGRGIGRALTGLCIDAARAAGAPVIALHTSEMMHGARHLYESMGFRMQREIPAIFGVRYFLYVMDLG